ncbi:MAG: PfkB family carbohydrate kinase [Polyangiaceae bacterium]
MTSTAHPQSLIVGSRAFDDLELPSGVFPNVVGGSATYAAFAASALAPGVGVVAVVGDDFDTSTVSALEARGVDTRGIERASGKTFRWAGRYSSDLESRVTLDTQLNVFAGFEPKIPKELRSPAIVLLGNIHPTLQAQVLDAIAPPKVVLADTMNFWIQGEPAALEKLLPRVDVLIVNDEEVRELSGERNVRKAALAVRKRGPRSVIVKRGEHGAALFDENGIFVIPGIPLESVVDPTGAGDSFAGGIVGCLSRELARTGTLDTNALRLGMVYGTATASFCVEDVGPRGVLDLSAAAIDRRLGELRSFVEVRW